MDHNSDYESEVSNTLRPFTLTVSSAPTHVHPPVASTSVPFATHANVDVSTRVEEDDENDDEAETYEIASALNPSTQKSPTYALVPLEPSYDLPNRAEERRTSPASPIPVASTSTAAETRVEESSTKRKSGRAKGPKAKKARLDGADSIYHTFRSDPPSIEVPTTHYPEVNEHNKKYYEFQWRVLNLCSEFYAAADGLLKDASPLVIAQSYAVGPGTLINPLALLNEAKRVCDLLMSNPKELVAQPPPPFPSILTRSQTHSAPTVHPPPPPPSAFMTATLNGPATSNAPTFPMPPQFAPYGGSTAFYAGSALTARYTAPYYPLPGGQAGYYTYPPPPTYGHGSMSGANHYPNAYYQPHPPTVNASMFTGPEQPGQGHTPPSAHARAASTSSNSASRPAAASTASASPSTSRPATTSATPAAPHKSASTASGSAAANTTPPALTSAPASTATSAPAAQTYSGPWSEWEVTRLRTLFEDSRGGAPKNAPNWDWVCAKWGSTRSIAQIFEKAAEMGLRKVNTSVPSPSRVKDSDLVAATSHLPSPTAPNSAKLSHPPAPVPWAAYTPQGELTNNYQHAESPQPAASPEQQSQPQPTASPSKNGLKFVVYQPTTSTN